MAYYHLTIKTDTKPDGSKISATEKAAYNDREGKYKNIDEERMKEHDIFQETIFSSNPIENFPIQEEMLYESPFGSIKRIPSGEIKVSKNASVETVAIALTLAQNLYNGDIEIDGTDKFLSRCLHTSADLELNINFKNQQFNEKMEQLKEEKNYVRRNLVAGPTRRTRERQLKRRSARRRSSLSRELVLHSSEYPGELFTRQTDNLPNVSERDVDVLGNESQMLVQRDRRVHVRKSRQQEAVHPPVRWSLSRARRNRIEDSAKQILNNIEENADKVFASSHLQYINREAAFQKRGGIIGGGHQLPSWANNNPKTFFEAADKYAPVNDERYKEIEFALPNELTFDQQQQLIDKFLELHLKDHYYAYAIHNKVGTLDATGQEHPHVHIMFSTKLIDEQERKQERPPELFFKKNNFRYPERGGPKKDTNWYGKNRRAHLCRVREDYARLQNEALQEAGIPLRVDHRSKKVQHKEALEQGFTTLAKLLEVFPEKYINMTDLLNQDSDDFKEKQKYRNYKLDYVKKLQSADHLERIIMEENVQNRINSARDNFTEIVSSDDDSDDSGAGEITRLKKHIIELLDQEVDLHGLVIKEADAIVQAQIAFMNPEERARFAAYRNLKEEKRSWLQFKKGLKKPPAYQLNDLAIYEKLIEEVDSAIAEINKKIDAAEKEKTLRDALIRLSNSAMEQKVMNAKLTILNENKLIRDKYYKLCDEIDKAMSELQEHLDKYEDAKRNESYEKDYNGDDLLKALYKERKILKNRLKKLEISLGKQEKKVFSLERAEAMAKDVFVRGEFKKLRQELRELKKREGYYAADIKKLEDLRSQIGPNPTSEQISAIQKEETRLAQMKNEIDATRTRLQNKQDELNRRCSEPKAVEKIADITKGILNKNQPEKKRRDLLVRRVSETNNKIKEIDKQIADLKKSLKAEHPETRFRVGHPKYNPEVPLPKQTAPSIISNALLGDDYCASFVYRKEGGKEDWQRDWEYMTEADKDEARLRRAYSDDY